MLNYYELGWTISETRTGRRSPERSRSVPRIAAGRR